MAFPQQDSLLSDSLLGAAVIMRQLIMRATQLIQLTRLLTQPDLMRTPPSYHRETSPDLHDHNRKMAF